jgi:hypothetical protein
MISRMPKISEAVPPNNEPSATVIDIKDEGRAQHQCAGNNCSNGNDQHERDERNRRPDNGEDASGKINHAFNKVIPHCSPLWAALTLEIIAKTPSTKM